SFIIGVSFGQEQLKLATRTCQTRHDRSDRNTGDVRNFFVRHSFQFAESDCLPKFCRQMLDCSAHCLSVLSTIQCKTRIQRWYLATVQFFIEYDCFFIHTIALESSECGVADDAEEPCPAVFAAKTVEKTKRPECSFLYNVLGILIFAHEETRQVVSGVEMR